MLRDSRHGALGSSARTSTRPLGGGPRLGSTPPSPVRLQPRLVRELLEPAPNQVRLTALITFRCELGGRQPVLVRIASRESCPNAQAFVDGGASDARS